jgi:predicted transcriptional regulator
MTERPELLGLATNIVSAHVSHNAIAADQLPGLIQQVFTALATVEQAATAPPKAEPAVAVKRSVFADHIVCLDCGKHLSMLKRHLMTDHKLTPEQYRLRWGLAPHIPSSHPTMQRHDLRWRRSLGSVGKDWQRERQGGKLHARWRRVGEYAWRIVGDDDVRSIRLSLAGRSRRCSIQLTRYRTSGPRGTWRRRKTRWSCVIIPRHRTSPRTQFTRSG